MKKKNQVLNQKKPKNYWSWEEYKKTLHSLYRAPQPKKELPREKFLNYLLKIGIVFVAAFFTTLSFSLLLRPNGIYNSGLNGFFQSILNLLTGYSENVREYYSLFLFGTAFLVNLAIIFILSYFYKGKIRILSTALFYSLAQIFWAWLFSFLQWDKFLFNSFSPENWSLGQKQLGFTLPFYVTIALLAALIHTYGYSLVFKARATPGGLEIITSHLSTQKSSKVTLSSLFKIFGFLIIFLITVINFLFIENNPRVKKAELKTYLLRKCAEDKAEGKKSFIHKEDKLETVLNEWMNEKLFQKNLEKKNFELETTINQETNPEIKQAKKEQIAQNKQKIFQIQDETVLISTHLKNKIGSENLEIYPVEELDNYLLDNERLKEKLESKITVEKAKSNHSQKELDYLEYLRKCLERAKRNSFEKTPISYFKYVTNDERLWATLVYIFVSAFLISQMFPKDIKVSLTIQAGTPEKWTKVLKLLKEFKPVYYISHFYEQKSGEKKSVYMVNCLLTKWEYYLIQQKLGSIGVIASISEIG